MNNNLRRYAKMMLKESGVKVFQKDVESVQILGSCYYGGRAHKYEIRVVMCDGVSYTVYRETRDAFGQFSINSTMFYTYDLEVRGF